MKYLFFLILICALHTGCDAGERKTIVVTGASGELGSATARVLAETYDLILTGRELTKLQKLQSELQSTQAGLYTVCPLDFVSKQSICNFKTYLAQRSSEISGVVLIGPRPQFHGKELIPEESVWLEVFQSTFTGPMEALNALLPHLKRPARVVVIAGTSSVQLQPEFGPSCVVRRMWTTYAKALSHHLGPQGISVNTLSPGIVLTNFHQERIQKKAEERSLSYDEQMTRETAMIPVGRHATPLDVAHSIQFLLSETAGFVNGVNLLLDGGYTVSY